MPIATYYRYSANTLQRPNAGGQNRSWVLCSFASRLRPGDAIRSSRRQRLEPRQDGSQNTVSERVRPLFPANGHDHRVRARAIDFYPRRPSLSTGHTVGASVAVQPLSATVDVGRTATFTITAAGSPPINYRWRKNGTNIGGAIGASYTTPPAALTDSGAKFAVEVSNSIGSSLRVRQPSHCHPSHPAALFRSIAQ